MKLSDRVKKFFNTNPFKGFFRENRMRPPGAVAEDRFMELCIRCARCIEVCPYESIKRADLYDRLQIGTPYIYAEETACYLCMECPPVCPTGALDTTLKDMRKVAVGTAVINQETCLNYKYVRDEERGYTDGTARICSICYNVCPLIDEAVVMKEFLLPVITEKCVGCGICVEKCPVEGKAVNIVPTGMQMKDKAGMHYRRTRRTYGEDETGEDKEYLRQDELLKKKENLTTGGDKPEFEADFNTDDEIEGWQ